MEAAFLFQTGNKQFIKFRLQKIMEDHSICLKYTLGINKQNNNGIYPSERVFYT